MGWIAEKLGDRIDWSSPIIFPLVLPNWEGKDENRVEYWIYKEGLKPSTCWNAFFTASNFTINISWILINWPNRFSLALRVEANLRFFFLIIFFWSQLGIRSEYISCKKKSSKRKRKKERMNGLPHNDTHFSYGFGILFVFSSSVVDAMKRQNLWVILSSWSVSPACQAWSCHCWSRRTRYVGCQRCQGETRGAGGGPQQS